jgi:L-asparaginase
MKTLPLVSVIFTGGTISMRFSAESGGAVPTMSGGQILELIPGLDGIAEVRALDFGRYPGPHMTPAIMRLLAREVQMQLDDPNVSGVVVTHGTDTLEETAFLLDCLLSREKPVALVGSMRNASELGWDGPANLCAAVRVVVDPVCRGLGTVVVMNGRILSGAGATKTNAESLQTFVDRDFGCLGIVDKDQIILARSVGAKARLEVSSLEESVEIIKLSAGSSGSLLRAAWKLGMKGFVIEGLGRGNVPLTALDSVMEVLGSGLPVILTSRCPEGRVLDSYAYEGAAGPLRKAGAILGGMLPSHKARLKLMLMLGMGATREVIRAAFEGAR